MEDTPCRVVLPGSSEAPYSRAGLPNGMAPPRTIPSAVADPKADPAGHLLWRLYPIVERFERAGRGDLLRPPYSRRRDGRLVLTLRKDGRCHHLGADNRCGVYAARPDACSTFPAPSEVTGTDCD